MSIKMHLKGTAMIGSLQVGPGPSSSTHMHNGIYHVPCNTPLHHDTLSGILMTFYSASLLSPPAGNFKLQSSSQLGRIESQRYYQLQPMMRDAQHVWYHVYMQNVAF